MRIKQRTMQRMLTVLLTVLLVLSELAVSGRLVYAAGNESEPFIEELDAYGISQNGIMDGDGSELNSEVTEDIAENNEMPEDILSEATTEETELTLSDYTDDTKITESNPDHIEVWPAFSDTRTVNSVTVSVSAPEGVFPDGSYLFVESIPVYAQSMVDEAVGNERDANANVAVSYTFDIKVLDAEGNEVQSADAQSVKVSFALAEAKDDNLEAQVYHISDEGNAEVLDTSVNGDAVEAVTDGFSFYTVEFTYGTMTYVLPGGSEVKLSDVLSYVGLSGEVTAASGSNDELFSITKESGEWMIHSHQPFTTEEKLSVTINGIVYEIIVTDTNVSGTIYASSLADNDNLVLTGDTTLVMDVNKSLKSISGAYALTIQGSNTLEVNNNAGHAISVKSLTSAAFLRLISSKYALNIEQNINTSGGLFIISDGVGAYSKNGSITISGKSTISSGEAAIFAPKGSISVNGDLTAETTKDKYFCVVGNNGVTLTGGTVSISSKTIAVRTAGDIELSGNITVTGRDVAINSYEGSVIIKEGSTVKASADYGIYATQNVTMGEGGTLTVTGTGRTGIEAGNGNITLNGTVNVNAAQAAIYAPKGSISVNGDLTAETTKDKYFCVVGNNGVTLTGGTVSISSKTIAVRTAGDIELSGNITVSSADSAAVNTLDGGNILIKNGSTINATGKYGLYAAGGITVEGGTVNAQGSSNAVYSNTGTITIHSPLAITTPAGGRVSGHTIVGMDDKPTKEVMIQNRPIPESCTVSINNGYLAWEGDILTLKYSSDFPAYRSVQWQREIGGGTWTDITGATQETYTAKAVDKGTAIRAKVMAAGYSGEKITTNTCTIQAAPVLGGTVSYGNSGYNSVYGYAYLKDAVSAVTSNLTPSGIPNNKLKFQWQVSADGSSGWTDITGATSATYTTQTGDLNKYIRVVVSAQGHIGKVNGSALKVKKSPATTVKVPELEISGDQVRVNYAQPNQQYLIYNSKQTSIPESAWQSAKSPATVSALYMGGTKDSVNYVYTRVRETETSYVGPLALSSIYLGSTTYLQDFYLDVTFMRGGESYTPEQDEIGRYNIRQGDVLKIEAVPIPSGASNYWGISGQNWLIDNYPSSTFGAFHISATGYGDTIQPSENYSTVYFKPSSVNCKNGLTLSASLNNSAIGYKYDEIKLNIGTVTGEYKTDNLNLGSNISIRKGAVLDGFSFSTTPEMATSGSVTATKTSGEGTEPTITFDKENRTFKVDASGATVGTYTYNVTCDNKSASFSATGLIVNVLTDDCTVTLLANNGTAQKEEHTVKIDNEFILPEIPDTFTKPSGFDFGGWDKGDVGDGVIIEDNTTIKVKWVPHVHHLIYIPAFEPTCTWDGNAAHYQCEDCGKLFEDADAIVEAPTTNYFVIPATGHTPSIVTRENEIMGDEETDGSYDEVVYCSVCHDEISRTHVILERRFLEKVVISATTQTSAFGPYLSNGSVTLNWKNGLTVAPSMYTVSDANQPYLDELSGEAVTDWDGDSCYVTYTISNNTEDDRSLIFSALEDYNCSLLVDGYNTECISVTPYITAGKSQVDIVFKLTKKTEYAIKGPEKVTFGAGLDADGNYLPPADCDIILENIGKQALKFTLSSENAVLSGEDAECFEIIKPSAVSAYPVSISAGTSEVSAAVRVKTGLTLEPNHVYTAELTLKTDHAADGAQITVPIAFSVTPPIPTGIWMEEIPAQDYTGKKIMPEVEVYWGEKLLTSADYTVSYKNNVNAYTLTDGQEGFNAKKAPTITIKGKGNYKGTFTRTFVINQADLTTQATAEDVKLKYTGKNLKPTTTVTANLGGQTVKLKAGTDYAYEYDTLPYSDKGTRYVSIKPKSGNFKGSQQFKVDIIDGILMSKVSIAKIKDVKWDGSYHEPPLTVKYGKAILTPGIDYTVTYTNNHAVGTATVTIKGTENLTPPEGHETCFGTITKTFKITGTSIAGAKIETTSAFVKNFDYDGTARIQPAGSYKLTLSKGSIVIPGYCYDVTYEKNENPGTAKMIFTGRPEYGYTGRITQTFKINGYDLSGGNITVCYNDGTEQFWSLDPGSSPDFAYNLGGVKPEPVVKFYGSVLKKGKDYTVTWSNNTSVKTVLTETKNPTVTIKGTGSFKGSITRVFKIKQKPFDSSNVTIIASDVTWQANKAGIYKPAVTVLENSTGKVLKAGKDFGAWNDITSPIIFIYKKLPSSGEKVKNYKGKNQPQTEVSVTEGITHVLPTHIIPAGTEIEITVTGKGAYENTTATATYKFVKKEVSITGSAFKIAIPEQQWTGMPVELKEGDITVTQKISKTETKTLTFGSDYEIVPGSYLNNINRGTAKVTIRGLHNGTDLYGGTKQVTFKIVQRRMNYVITYDKNEKILQELMWSKLTPVEQSEANTNYGSPEKWFAANYHITGTMKNSATLYAGALSAGTYKLQRYNAKTGKWVSVPAAEVSFKGWATKPNGSKQFDNKAPFKPSWFWRLTYDDSVTLYAVWGNP